MTNHLEACRNALQLFGNIFTELPQGTAAIGAAVVRGKMRDHFTRKILRQRLACRARATLRIRLSRRSLRRFGCHLRSFFGSLSSLQFLKPELKLFQFSRELLALPAEDHTPVFFDYQLQMFDLLRVRSKLLMLLHRLRMLGDHQRLQRFRIESVKVRQGSTNHVRSMP